MTPPRHLLRNMILQRPPHRPCHKTLQLHKLMVVVVGVTMIHRMIQLRLSVDRGPEVPPKMAAGVEAGANQGLDLGHPPDQKAALDLEVTPSLRTDQSLDLSQDHAQDLIQDPNLAPGQSQDPNL